VVHGDSEEADFLCFKALVNEGVWLHHVEELMLERISLPEKKDDILCLILCASCLRNPLDVLVESH
jgi:hypothetical protein